MIPYSTQTINKQDLKAVNLAMKSFFLTQGPKVSEFEKKLTKKVGSKYGVAVNSATSALHIACLAVGLKKKDIFWTVPNTFVASANCGRLIGAKVDFVDINPRTFNIDTDLLEKKLINAKKKNKLPKLIIPVHFAGQPTNQKKIWQLSKKYNFRIIEDASHSLGAKLNNEKVGSCKWSDITVFSFHPVKMITTLEGGAALTKNYKLYKNLKLFSNHGITKQSKYFINKKEGPWYYEQQTLGLNYRMSEISAALGISQLKRLNYFFKKRNNLAKMYDKNLDSSFVFTPYLIKGAKSSYHLYVIKLKDSVVHLHKTFFEYLRKNKINVNLHYIPVHLQPYYKKLGFSKGNFANSEKHANSVISLPIYPDLGNLKIRYICKKINFFFKTNK